MKINIFLGGGVKLLHGDNPELKGYRNEVIDPVISQLNSSEYAKHIFIAKDYSDITRHIVSANHQKVYNRFILHKAQIAVFIIDGKIGNITRQEIEIAVNSTRRTKHPIVYIYGKNVDNEDILNYLNKEGIYYQHFFDNRDLANKLKTDMELSSKRIERRKHLKQSLYILCVLSIILPSIGFVYPVNKDESVIDNCTAQLYLMRYYDINALTGSDVFNEKILSGFKYEDSVTRNHNIAVFPMINSDSIVLTTPPFFRLKIHNKGRKTIVFREAFLEVEKYKVADYKNEKNYESLDLKIPDINTVRINQDKDYRLPDFRLSMSYSDVDDRYYFALISEERCTFRFRVKAKSQDGDFLYSNYIYVNYVI